MDQRHADWLNDRELLKTLTEPRAIARVTGAEERANRRAEVERVFLRLHAAVHAAQVSQGEGEAQGSIVPTFHDEAVEGLREADFTRLPAGVEHSAAWLIWHIARCEDITMNLLVAGTPQVLHQGWLEEVCSPAAETGNAFDGPTLAAFHAAIKPARLLAYRAAVGRRTREIVRALALEDYARKVAPERIRRVAEEGAVAPSDGWLLEYWGGRTTAGLLLMPATRHPLVHLDEAARLKKKLKRCGETQCA